MKVIGIAKNSPCEKEYLVHMADKELAALTGLSPHAIRQDVDTGSTYDVVDTYDRARKTLKLYRELENNLNYLYDHLTTFKELLQAAEEKGEIMP